MNVLHRSGGALSCVDRGKRADLQLEVEQAVDIVRNQRAIVALVDQFLKRVDGFVDVISEQGLDRVAGRV